MQRPKSAYNTRASAALAGSVRFFTGIPCKRGHLADRFTSNGGCADCINVQVSKRGTNVRGATFVFAADEPTPTLDEMAILAPMLQPTLLQLLGELRTSGALPVTLPAPITVRPFNTVDTAHGMTEKAGYLSYAQYRAVGWTDEQLVEAGLMVKP
jgi:hypothetical protein